MRATTIVPLALLYTLAGQAADPMPAFRAGVRVLFQGDSITDGKRGRTADPNHILGHGYAFLIAAHYGALLPERQLTFLNRGISGNTVEDLALRWQPDTLELQPDILSVLIGINDTSRHVPPEQFEAAYDKLLAASLAANPKLRLVLGEPFTLRVGKHKDDWDEWRAEVRVRQLIVARLAAKYHAALVPFQKVFDDACQRAPADYWIWDGVHPTYSGHQLMADAWVRAVRARWPE
jgi:lysophospholipase L1-like esterase